MDKCTYSGLLAQLSACDTVTFDIFDTLITRCVYKPVDIFTLVARKAKAEAVTDRDFFHERQQAEQLGYRVHGERNTLDTVYALLAEQFGYTDAQCRWLKETELAMEEALILPRQPMPSLLRELLAQGKRIILCSDMYLSAGQICRLLDKCGYPSDLELWVSCERGASKHSGKLWEQLFASLPAGSRTVHLGDNEWADYRILKQMGKDALWIPGGRYLFEHSRMYPYLSGFLSDDAAAALMLGYLVNKACFNSPFPEEFSGDAVTASWMGPAFACFMDWLVSRQDDSLLLFVTREGYLLKPLYEAYCAALGIAPQSSVLFYASRAATLSATVTSEAALGELLQFAYDGTLGHFAKNRLNFTLPDGAPSGEKISLPAQKKAVMQLLKPYLKEILENGRMQHEAYRQYISQIRPAGKPLTVVDVGYTGTTQYAIATVLSEAVGGRYLYLNELHTYKKAGCTAECLCKATVGLRPIYHNLLFLEAAMQAPHGQLQAMVLHDGHAEPVFNGDANFAEAIPAAQSCFLSYVEWIGSWKAMLGDALQLNFELAEAIWVCLLKFGFLPPELLEGFRIADDFTGNPMWKYDPQRQVWVGQHRETPLCFPLPAAGQQRSAKQRLKQWVKDNIPDWAYLPAKKIWNQFIR